MRRKLIIIFIICFSFTQIFCKTAERTILNKEIDLNLEKSQEFFGKFNFVESIRYAEIARNHSVINRYDAGIIKSNIYLAKNLLEIGAYTHALKCLDVVASQKTFKDHLMSQVEVHRIKGRTYGMLKLYDNSITEFKKQLELSAKIEDHEKRLLSTFWAHENLSHIYGTLNLRDSAYSHLNQQIELLKNLPEEASFYNVSSTYVQLAEQYIKDGQLEKAEDLLNQSMALLKKYEATYLFGTLEQYGNLELSKGNLKLAETYFRKGLQNALDLKDKDAEMHFYDVISDFYFDHNLSKQEANIFLSKHKKLKDSLDRKSTTALNIGLKQITDEKNNELKQKDTTKTIILIIGSVLFLLGVLYFAFSKRTHEKNIAHFQKVLTDLDEKLKVKAEFIDQLQRDELSVPKVTPAPSKTDASVIVNAETEKKLLLKLQEFEESTLFTENTISLSILSTYCETNSKYLSYAINAYKKKDFNNYINELRVNYIIEKLKNVPLYRKYKIAVLAEEAGFSSQNKFSSVFKKVTTISPSVFIAYLQKSDEV